MKKGLLRWKRGFAAVAGLGVFAAATAAQADGFRNPPPGAAGLGRSGNVTAQGDDTSVLSYNPANLTELKSPSAEAAVSFARQQTKFSAPDGRRATSKDPWQALPDLYAAGPIAGGDGAIGLAVTTPFGQSMEWEKDSALRYLAPYYAKVTLFNFNPAVAWRLGQRVSVGAGADVFVSSLEFRQAFPWAQALGAPGLPDGEVRADTDGTGFGGNAGLTWKVTGHQTLALAYRSRVTVDYDGDLRISGAPPARDPGRQDFSTRLKFPDSVSAGYGVELTDQWRIEADVEWLGWSANDSQPLQAGRYDPLLGSTSIRNDWKDTVSAGVGTDWTFAPGWIARAGYTWLPSPVPDDTFSPILPDADRHVVSLGVGWRSGRHRVDLAWAYSFYQDRKIRDNQQPGLNGTYELSADLVGVSYACAF